MRIVREATYYTNVAINLAEEEDDLLNTLLPTNQRETDMTNNRTRARCKREYDRKIRIFKAKAWIANCLEKFSVLTKTR